MTATCQSILDKSVINPANFPTHSKTLVNKNHDKKLTNSYFFIQKKHLTLDKLRNTPANQQIPSFNRTLQTFSYNPQN